jgi:hypothetical protein
MPSYSMASSSVLARMQPRKNLLKAELSTSRYTRYCALSSSCRRRCLPSTCTRRRVQQQGAVDGGHATRAAAAARLAQAQHGTGRGGLEPAAAWWGASSWARESTCASPLLAHRLVKLGSAHLGRVEQAAGAGGGAHERAVGRHRVGAGQDGSWALAACSGQGGWRWGHRSALPPCCAHRRGSSSRAGRDPDNTRSAAVPGQPS